MKKIDELVNHCPFCGSENIEWMGDAFGEETPFHCHECDRWFSAEFIWNDFCDAVVTTASRQLADEVYIQKGMTEPALDHDDSWYELQEELREKMLEAAAKVINNSNFYSV